MNNNTIELINENGKAKSYGRIPDLYHLIRWLNSEGMSEEAENVKQVWFMAHDLKSVIEKQGKACITERSKVEEADFVL